MALIGPVKEPAIQAVSCSQQVLEAFEDTAGVAGFGFLRAKNNELTVRKTVRILHDPQVYEECEDWSLHVHMTD
jgi:hypothetical protein